VVKGNFFVLLENRKNNTDRNRFLERLGSVLQKPFTPCCTRALKEPTDKLSVKQSSIA
jgi:hypothetical protein